MALYVRRPRRDEVRIARGFPSGSPPGPCDPEHCRTREPGYKLYISDKFLEHFLPRGLNF